MLANKTRQEEMEKTDDTVNIGNTEAKSLEWVCNLHDAQKQVPSKKQPQNHLKRPQNRSKFSRKSSPEASRDQKNAVRPAKLQKN